MAADAQSVVELIFRGRDETAEATQAALNNAQKFSTGVQNIAGPIADATAAAIKFEAAIVATGAAITAFAIKAAGDFDSAFREISTLVDAPIEDLDRFRQAILDYSTDSTASLEQITSAVYSAISAGVDYTDSLDFLRQAEQLSIAGRADLSESLLVLVSSLNAYGESTDEAARFSDLLFTTVEKGQTTLPELAASLSQVTGIAATAGVSFDELLAAVAALTATGTPTAQAVTQIRGAISALLKPSSQASDLAAELGIEFNAQRLAAVGLDGVLQEVKEATGGNVEQMALLFGRVEALNGVLTLTGLGADRFADNLLAMDQAAGATGDAYDKMAGDIEQSNQRLSNALRGLLIEIGQPLLDEYGSVTSAIAEIFNALGVSVQKGELGGLVDYIESVMADLAGVLEDVARNLPAALESADLSGFTRNLEAVIEGVRELLSGVDLSTEDGLKTLIEGVGAGFARLGEFVGSAVAALGPLLDALLKIAETIVNLDERWFQLGGTVGGVAIVIDKVLGPALDLLLAIFLVKQGGGLVKGLASAAAGFGGLSTAVGTFSGYLAVGASLWKIGELAGILFDWAGAAREAASAQDLASRSIADSESELQRVAAELGIVVGSYEEFWQLVKDGAIVADEASGRWVLATERQSDAIKNVERDYDAYVEQVARQSQTAADSQGELAAAMAQIGLVWDDNLQAFRSATAGIDEVTDATAEATDESKRWTETLVDGVPTFTQVGAAATAGFNDAATAAEDATRKSEAYLLKMEEIASNERIRGMELSVGLDVAQLEADTARIQAAFDSITTSITGSQEVLGELYGLFAQADSRWDQLTIESFIRDENERLDEQLELQKRLTEAQINEISARTRAINAGQGLIQVDGAGLQPHLEAFMWEILRAIQVRVNADGMDLLLGV